MKICKTIVEIRAFVHQQRKNGHSIGFVPTMGALHEGHIDLVAASNKKCDITVASIFVNPTQFNNSTDLEKYPRKTKEDTIALENHQCDALFMPDVEEVYGHKKAVEINLGSITEELEGKLRPGHFNGVALVVSKLFNIIQPELAFFGQKDVQQFFVIQKLRDALNFNIELEMVPTRREKSGLAMSSRNLRLSQADAQEASLIYTCLKMAKENLLKGTSLKSVKDSILELFESSERLALEYFEAVSIDDFKPLTVVEEKSKIVLCMAAVIGNVRLIDNIPLFS